MLINDLDAKVTYGFAVSDAPGWADAPPRVTPGAQVLRRGGIRVVDNPRDQARQITMRGTIIGTSTQDARDKADALRLACYKLLGAKLSFDDYSGRYVVARCEAFRIPPYGPSMIQSKLSVEAVFTAQDPYSYDNAAQGATTLDATGNNHKVLGTGPSRPIITLTGAQVNPVLTLYNFNATVSLGSMGFTVTMIAGDTLVIDCDAKTAKLNGVNRLDLLTSGDFFTFEPLVDTGPAIQYTSGGAGAATGSFVYRKSWR